MRQDYFRIADRADTMQGGIGLWRSQGATPLRYGTLSRDVPGACESSRMTPRAYRRVSR